MLPHWFKQNTSRPYGIPLTMNMNVKDNNLKQLIILGIIVNCFHSLMLSSEAHTMYYDIVTSLRKTVNT